VNKKLAIVLTITAFLIGAITGYRAASRKYEKDFLRSSKAEDSGYVQNRVYLLNLLRTNNTAKVIENLEMNLDWELISLGHYMSNAPKSPLDPYILKQIREAKQYREKFPHKGDNLGVDQNVSNVFSLVSSPTNK
jgi:hypothetical protein